MKVINVALGCAIAIELIAGGVFAFRKQAQTAPPAPVVPELSHVDPFVGAHIRELAAKCQTPEDWAGLGEVYLAYGYFTEAEACYRVAVAGSPNRVEWVHHWGFSLERLGKATEANGQYERAIELGMDHGVLVLHRPESLAYGECRAARQAFERPAINRRRATSASPRSRRKPAEAMPIMTDSRMNIPIRFIRRFCDTRFASLAVAATASGVGSLAPEPLPSPFYVDWSGCNKPTISWGSLGRRPRWVCTSRLTAAATPRQ